MSKVQLQGNASGTGIFTIASPNSNTDRTINLPDAAGTLQVSGNPISGTTGTFTGLLDISAAGAGQIQFPATQNASSNANTLDDYEEGSWTPEFNSSTAGTGRVTSNTFSRYIKIGKLVYFTSYATLSTLGTGGSGNWLLKGLPFTSSTVSNAHFSVSVGYFDSLNGNVNYITGTVQPGLTEILFRGTTAATNTITNFTFSTYMAAGSSMIVSGCYEANA